MSTVGLTCIHSDVIPNAYTSPIMSRSVFWIVGRDSLLPKESPNCFETRPCQPWSFENFGGGSVNCLKITEDKSSDNRVLISDARLIKATRAKAKRRARSLCLNTIAMPRRIAQNPRLSTTSVLKHKAWSPRQSLKPACHAPLPKIRWSGDATRVGDAYTQRKYLTYMR